MKLEIGISIIANLAIITTLVVALFNYKSSIKNKKRDRALSFIERYNDFEFHQFRNDVIVYIEENELNNLREKDFLQKMRDLKASKSNYHIRMKFSAFLNYYEEMAIAANREIVDMEILFEYFLGIIPSHFEKLKPYIEHKRTEYKDRTLWSNFEELYCYINKRKVSAE